MKSHILKPIEYLFAKYYARGGYTREECLMLAHEQTGKDLPKNLSAKASRWSNRPDIMGYVKYQRREYEKQSKIDAQWLRQELVDIIKFGRSSEKRQAIETLAKMNGYFDKDNQQKAQVTLNMEF